MQTTAISKEVGFSTLTSCLPVRTKPLARRTLRVYRPKRLNCGLEEMIPPGNTMTPMNTGSTRSMVINNNVFAGFPV